MDVWKLLRNLLSINISFLKLFVFFIANKCKEGNLSSQVHGSIVKHVAVAKR